MLKFLPDKPIDRHRLLLLVGLVVLSAALCSGVSISTGTQPDVGAALIAVFGVIVLCALFSELDASDDESIATRRSGIAYYGVICVPWAATELFPQADTLPLVAVATLSIAAGVQAWFASSKLRMLGAALAMSTSVAMVLLIGRVAGRPFADHLFALAATGTFLTARLIVTILLLSYLTALGGTRALAGGPPAIRSLPFGAPEPRPVAVAWYGPLLHPPEILLCFVIRIGVDVVQLGWRMVATILVVLGLTLMEVTKALFEAVRDVVMRSGAVELVLLAAGGVLLGLGCVTASPSIAAYLRTPTTSMWPTLGGLRFLGEIALLFMVGFIATASFRALIVRARQDGLRDRAMLYLSGIGIGFMIAGFLVFSISKVVAPIRGFAEVGTFSASMTILGIGGVFLLMFRSRRGPAR